MDKKRYIRRLETVLAYYFDTLFDRPHRGQLFESELESFIFAIRRLDGCAFKYNLYRKIDSFYKQEIEKFIDSTEDMETEPHQKTALEQFDYCARTFCLFMEPIIALGISKENEDVDFKIAGMCFIDLKDAYIQDYLRPYREPGKQPKRQRIRRYIIKSFQEDKTIFLELTATICIYLSIADDFQKVSQIIKSVINHLDSLLMPKRDITPNDILSRLSHLPQPVYQGICSFYLQSGFITEALYYKLVLSIKSDDTDSFSTIISENNLYLKLAKYYDLIALADDLNSTLNERQFAPEDYIGLISNYYDQLASQSKSRTKASRVGISVVGIYNDIKDCLEILTDVGQFCHKTFRLERFSLYERFCQIKFSTTSNIPEYMIPEPSVDLQRTNQPPVDAKTPNQTTITNEEEFNCKTPEKDLDPFLDYLVWRGYLKEGDQTSFKYDVFGGHKPIDYRTISFNTTKNAGKKMLGVIIWKLREENDDPERLYDMKIAQSYSQISTGEDSMRIFVDFGLFFPTLVCNLKMSNSRLEPIRERLMKRVQELSGIDEYKNCSSILEFIQQREKKERNYWVVSKKMDD